MSSIDVLDVVDDRQVFARTGSRRAPRPNPRDYGTLCEHLPIYSDAAQPEFMINIWFIVLTIISKQYSCKSSNSATKLSLITGSTYFNDFVGVGLLRTAICAAVKVGNGVEHENITQAVFDSLALPLTEYSNNPRPNKWAVDEIGRALKKYWDT
jgi:hypothetical protein